MKEIKINHIMLRGLIPYGQNRKLAEALRTSRMTFYAKLRGEGSFTIDELNTICEELNISFEDFAEIKKAA